MCMVSLRAMSIRALHNDLNPQHRSGDPFDGPVVLFNDVVEVLALTQQDVDASGSLDAFNGGRAGSVEQWNSMNQPIDLFINHDNQSLPHAFYLQRVAWRYEAWSKRR